MSVAIVTGSSGLIGSETVKFLHEQGLEIIGIDSDMRQYFFGKEASTEWKTRELKAELKSFHHTDLDVRNEEGIASLFETYGQNIAMVVHTAAQPSHDWAAKEPLTDFTINANGTINLLEATRRFAPEASFIFTSTNKVYGDRPNFLPLEEKDKRWELAADHKYFEHGIDETMSIDHCKHSIFGASKVAADVICQEYGRYFGLNTVSFRGGCLTGPAHSGAELHGFLAYLIKCALTEKKYTIYGYKGKQVRDNIHSHDLVSAFWEYHKNPSPGKVYNMGGSRHSNCSILEAIDLIESLTGKRLQVELAAEARIGDHIWYVSDVRAFQKDYPNWRYQYDLTAIFSEIIAAGEERFGRK